jgi:protein-serine/threonine kinase
MPMHTTGAGSFVFSNDAEEIRAHKWFRNVPWDRLHLQTPPFVPQIRSADDTRYFEDDERISDWSSTVESSAEEAPMGLGEIRTLLRGMRDVMHTHAADLLSKPYDVRTVDKKIDGERGLLGQEREVLKQFVRAYGRKQKKVPRDPLLRDPEVKKAVLAQRRKTAFMGYTWRRRRMYGYDFAYRPGPTTTTTTTMTTMSTTIPGADPCSVHHSSPVVSGPSQCLLRKGRPSR